MHNGADLFPGFESRLITTASGGHYIAEEAPDELLALVLPFFTNPLTGEVQP